MKKIMFNDRFGLTKAVLEGRKTQTRRIVPQSAIQRVIKYQEEYYNATLDNISLEAALKQLYFEEMSLKLPYTAGEIVAIAQSYKDCYANSFFYKGTPGWTNKMFVKANVMRYRIKITDARIEQLYDISDEDCLKEGIYENGCIEIPDHKCLYNYDYSGNFNFQTPVFAYANLTDRISGKGTWDKNPFVFVYDFKLID